jgi:hypothetical protein
MQSSKNTENLFSDKVQEHDIRLDRDGLPVHVVGRRPWGQLNKEFFFVRDFTFFSAASFHFLKNSGLVFTKLITMILRFLLLEFTANFYDILSSYVRFWQKLDLKCLHLTIMVGKF